MYSFYQFMVYKMRLIFFLILSVTIGHAQDIPNRLIDASKFQDLTSVTLQAREARRLTEEQFIKASQSSEYIIVDARSKNNFDIRHIKNAINLPFTEFTEQTLKNIIPSKDSKVLIYCNNNFLGSPIAFASKIAPASLNLSTQVSLAAYGYKNVYELGPLLHVNETKIEFSGTEVKNPLIL